MKSLNIYKKRFKEFGVDPKALLWKSRGAAHQRFRQFWAEIDFDNKSVLDIGCGFGEMGNFLTKRYENVLYKGVDITSEFIKNGKLLYPHLDLEIHDFHALTKAVSCSDIKFNVVLASGVLNSNYGSTKKNMDYRKKSIKEMFALTDNCFAFNMLGSHPQLKNKKDSNVWYADSLEILNFCMTLTKKVLLRSNYHPTDFTIFMYKTNKK